MWKATLAIRSFAAAKIPLLFFVRPTVVALDDERCEVQIKLRRRTKKATSGRYPRRIQRTRKGWWAPCPAERGGRIRACATVGTRKSEKRIPSTGTVTHGLGACALESTSMKVIPSAAHPAMAAVRTVNGS